MSFFHTHAHSHYSVLDAMGSVDEMVNVARTFRHPALGLTDHGVMSGSFQLYRHCRDAGLLAFPGLEAYVVEDVADKSSERFHLTLLAYTTTGYQNLVTISSTSHQREHFHRKPRIDYRQLARWSEAGHLSGIACLSGCYFSDVVQSLVRGDPARSSRLLRTFDDWFDFSAVELQHHHTQHDDGWTDAAIVAALSEMAADLGLPTIVTGDSHYCHRRSKTMHDAMKSIAYSADTGDVSFPGDSYHIASEQWTRKHFDGDLAEAWNKSQPTYEALLDRHSLVIDPLDRYSVRVPRVDADDPNDQLAELCELRAEEVTWTSAHQRRLTDELDVIAELGMAPYFLIVHDYVSFCRDEGITAMARGSAVGSLVCYLLRMSWIDPIEFGLRFDRFLSPNRIRPPDIDIDVDSSRRQEVVDYLAARYEVVHIGTFSTLGLNSAGKGSLLVKYLSMKRRMDERFHKVYASVKTIDDLQTIDTSSAKMLRAIDEHSVRSAAGKHAAGLVLSGDQHPISKWLPTMLVASSGTTVTQMEMDDVEDAGYLKLDLLGLRSLHTYDECLRLVGISHDDAQQIPLDDDAVYQCIRRGRQHTGIFQFEGWSAANGCQEMGVQCFEDLVLVNALYRPAARDSGYDVLYRERRAIGEWPRFHPIFDEHLASTFGVPVFQEQVLGILTSLGVEADRLADYLKAIKHKHGGRDSKKLYHKNKTLFRDLCRAADVPADEAWEIVEAFSAYGFNRSHAVAYSLLGYRLAWLRVHHPLQFSCALLSTSEDDDYLGEITADGIRVLGVCVNESGVGWKISESEDNALRRGLTTVKGIGVAAAQELAEHAPYKTVNDIVLRCDARKVTGGKSWVKNGTLNGSLEKLRMNGALRAVGLTSRETRIDAGLPGIVANATPSR